MTLLLAVSYHANYSQKQRVRRHSTYLIQETAVNIDRTCTGKSDDFYEETGSLTTVIELFRQSAVLHKRATCSAELRGACIEVIKDSVASTNI
jgi:hypothetical protein